MIELPSTLTPADARRELAARGIGYDHVGTPISRRIERYYRDGRCVA